jgi:hypothetical protein
MSPTSSLLKNADSDSASAFTLQTVHVETDSEELTASIVHPLLSPNRSESNLLPTYGTLPTTNPPSNPPPSYFSLPRHKPLLTAAIKFAMIFVLSSLVLGGTLWIALPRLEESVVSFLLFIFMFQLINYA